MPAIRKNLKRTIEKYAAEWTEIQPAWLGDFTQTVETGTPGIYYARLLNGRVIQIHNTQQVPPTFDLHVQVAQNRHLPKIWQVIRVVEDYDAPAAAGQIAYHHSQHEFPAGDTVWINRKQVLTLVVLVSDAANYVVQVYGGIIRGDQRYIQISNQEMDLSAQVVTVGALYVNIEADETGTLSAHAGTNCGAVLAATADKIPIPGAGKYIIATVLFYEDQTELSDDDILIPMPVDRSGATEMIKYDFLLMGA